jgi:hypothetical protein
MTALLWRVLIAVISVVLVFALIPLVARVLGFPIEGDLWAIFRLCIAGIAVFYILNGPPLRP